MTRTKKKTESKLPLLIAIILVIIAGALLVWYFLLRNNTPSHTTITTKDKNATTPQAGKDNIPPANTTPSGTSNQVPVDNTAHASLDTLDQEGDKVVIKATITNSDPGGTCVITFTKDQNKPVVHEFASTQDGATVRCDTSTISPLEFSSLGDWVGSLRYYVGNAQVTAQKKITIR